MIEDVDSVGPEPTRRRHVAVLSAVTAAMSLALLALLFLPPSRFVAAPRAASPAPSAGTGTTITFLSNPLTNMPLDLSRTSTCPDGSRLVPPYHLFLLPDTGQIFAVFEAGSRPAMRVRLNLDAATGRITVACATPDIAAPWESDAR